MKREQLRRQALEALHHLTQAYQENGDLANALTAAWRLVDLEPWSEESHRELMLLLGLSGRRAAALSQYETCRRVLAEELNVEPSTETIRIYEQIRDGKIKPLTQTPERDSAPAEAKPDTTVEPLPITPEAQSPSQRRQIPWLKLTFAALLVIVLTASGYYLLNRKTSTPGVASAQGEVVRRCPGPLPAHICLVNAQTGLITQITQDSPMDDLGPGFSWSPDGKQIVFSGLKRIPPGQPAHLYVMDRAGTNLRPLTSGDTNDILPAWSPDGEWIAYHGSCALWIIHPDGTGATALSDALCATSIAWSPDSQWIAFLEEGMRDGSRPSTIRAFERDGSDSRIVYTFSQPVNHGQVAWSPDGQQIFVLYNTGGNQDNTILLDAQGQGAIKQGIETPTSWFPDFYPQWGK